MISLILPYWDRQQVTDKAMTLLWTHYHDLDLEIIVVDDGNKEPYRKTQWPLCVKIVRLPEKSNPMDSCLCYNKGFEVATGDYIALSNPETFHVKPVLEQMRDSIQNDNDYVMAAAWCPEHKRWHCHSSMKRSDSNDVGSFLPKGANYHFMSMMKRSLWPGFDEDYRMGAGYSDADFVMRIKDANFIMRDDLVVEHVRTGARAQWTAPMFARNRDIFMRKWGKNVENT